MFKNLRQKTLNNSTADTSVISSRSVSANSLADDQASSIDPNISIISSRYQSVESLSSITESLPIPAQSAFGNLEDIISDLRVQINKKDDEIRKQALVIKDNEKVVQDLKQDVQKEIQSRLALERAYEKLEDDNEVEISKLKDKMEAEKRSAFRQLENQMEKLKKDNEKLSKKNSNGDAVAWQNKAESFEKAYTELMELQEHSEIQMQKMKDLLKIKDDELLAFQNKFKETEERYQMLQKQHGEGEGSTQQEFEAINWKAAQAEQELVSLEKRLITLERETEELRQKSSDKDFRIGRLREDIKNKELIIDTQKSDSLELANAVDRTTKLLNETKEELHMCKESYTKSLNDLQAEIDSLSAQYSESRNECRRQTDLVEQLQIAASATKTMKMNLQDDLDGWKQKLVESNDIILDYEAKQQNHQQEIDEYRLKLAKMETLSVEISQLKEEILSLQQNEDELRQENEFLTVARESWMDERNEKEALHAKEKASYEEKIRSYKDELELFRRSSQSNILPVSSNLQAKFQKGVTEVDISTRRDLDDEGQTLKQRCNALEKELADKTKQLKQNQQHLLDLKKTLQNEIRSGGGTGSPITAQGSPALGRKADSGFNGAEKSGDGQGLNIEYLKHCVMRYMCSLDTIETNYLVRVVSVLLKFTDEENTIVKEALEYKNSWFRQIPPKSLKKLKSTRS